MKQAKRFTYPFTAIVGQEPMKRALMLIAVQPLIGGVLILGERGTAKTTAVRALPDILGRETRVVELPLNATEDRVVGTLHVGTLMKSGEREFVPGVLAEADGNVLYVDEINLLEDHIVDLLLDAAATGTCRFEREGMSQEYAARFVLIGTMNPEEGTLRPQLLDRFGLSVRVMGSLTSEERLELVRRQVQFEEDPEGFCARFAADEQACADALERARELYPQVRYPDSVAKLSANLCNEISVDGYRADITMMRTARALAALDGRVCATPDDIMEAARFVLPHRMKRLPFDEVEVDDRVLERAMGVAKKNAADELEQAGDEAESADDASDSEPDVVDDMREDPGKKA